MEAGSTIQLIDMTHMGPRTNSYGTLKQGALQTSLSPEERTLHRLVEEGDVDAVESHISNNPGLDLNARNFQGRYALEIAVTNQNEAMVRFLLGQPNMYLRDSLLHAIKEENITIVEILLDADARLKGESKREDDFESAEFTPHMSPLVLAAQCDNYEIVKMLIMRGHQIKIPTTEDYPSEYAKYGEMLELSLARIDCYRALSSPSHIALSSSDPILTAFSLSHEANKMTLTDPVFKDEYEELSQKCREFAVSMLNECQTSQEVWLLLTREHDISEHNVSGGSYPRLRLAIEYDQKEFVTHPNCQQVLQNVWTEHHPNVMWMSSVGLLFYFLPRMLLLPFVYIGYFFAPCSSIWESWKAPMNKFMGHLFSYIVFLCLVFVTIVQDANGYSKRAIAVHAIDICIYAWIAGMLWEQVKIFWWGGIKVYIKHWWNIYDLVYIGCFIAAFVARMVSFIRAKTIKGEYETEERKYWPWNDPMLVSESLYCLASIFAFMRLLYLCLLSQFMGPLQLSLSKMMYDVMQIFSIFLLVLFAFSTGMTRLYASYRGSERIDEEGNKAEQPETFTNWFVSFHTLFWNLLGIGEKEYADVVVSNVYNDTFHTKPIYHTFTEQTGYFLYGLYHLITIVTVLNMLIAMMGNTLNSIQDNADKEWKFARSRLWMDFFEHEGFLPVPLNLLPTPKGIYDFFVWLKVKACGGTEDGDAKCSAERCCYVETREEQDTQQDLEKQYQHLITRLIQRFMNQQQQKEDEDVVTPDHLEQTKLDILREMHRMLSRQSMQHSRPSGLTVRPAS